MSNKQTPLLVFITRCEETGTVSIKQQVVVIDSKLYTLHTASLSPGYAKGRKAKVTPGGESGLEKPKSRKKPQSDVMKLWTEPVKISGQNAVFLTDTIIKRWVNVEWDRMPSVVVSESKVAFIPEQLTDESIVTSITIRLEPAKTYLLSSFITDFNVFVSLYHSKYDDVNRNHIQNLENGLYVNKADSSLFLVRGGKSTAIERDQSDVAVQINMLYDEFMQDDGTKELLRRGFVIDEFSSTVHGRCYALYTVVEEIKTCVAVLKFNNR